jgi:hypothetical protein
VGTARRRKGKAFCRGPGDYGDNEDEGDVWSRIAGRQILLNDLAKSVLAAAFWYMAAASLPKSGSNAQQNRLAEQLAH